jgi:hypothetical protein
VASDDRDPVADNPPINRDICCCYHDNITHLPARRLADHLPRGEGPGTRSFSGLAVPGAFFRLGLRWGDPIVNCRVAVVRSMLEEPGRRIGQRGDATRAPSQAPRPGWAAGRRPSASRDWPQSDKSIDSF